MRQRLIKLLGGYTRDEVLTTAVKHLFNTLGEDDIIREEKNQWLVGDKPIIEAEKNLLIAEAKQFLSTKLWRYLQNDVKYRANKMMFEQSKSETDLIAGKLWLYTLDVISTRLNSMSKGVGRFK